MTRKSNARLKRDAEKKHLAALARGEQNKTHEGWDLLQGLHQRCVTLISGHTLTTNLTRNKALHPYLGDAAEKATLVANMRLFAHDVTDHVEQLRQIYALHAHRTGGEANENEGLEVIHINELYVNWMTVHDANLLPVWHEIMDAMGRAEQRKINHEKDVQAQAVKDLLDPTVVSDVEAVDVAAAPIETSNQAA